MIILLRHGKPNLDTRHKITPKEFGEWIDKYNISGVDSSFIPSQLVVNLSNQCTTIICSNLPRSIESAKLLGKDLFIVDPKFRECEIPFFALNCPKLSFRLWTVIFRLLWLLGYSNGVESFKEAKKRAVLCVEKLIQTHSLGGNILVVGHGSINLLIEKYLQRTGWRSVKNSSSGYWKYKIFESNS